MRTTVLIAYPYDATLGRTLAALPGIVTAQPWPGAPSIGITGGERAVYLADRNYLTEPDEDPSNQLFAGRLKPALSRQVSLFAGPEPNGESRASQGDIVAINSDGGLDEVVAFGWDGRDVELRAGDSEEAIADFTTVLTGTIDRLHYDFDKIVLRNRDPGARLDSPLDRERYGGTGGADGDSDLDGVYKPYLAGRCRNVTPARVSAADNLYQFHDGPVNALDGLRDQGVALTLAGDYGTAAELLAASTGAAGSGADIEAGEYATCLSAGLARLGTDPTGQVTGDAEGDAEGSYVNDTANIMRRIVSSRLGAFSLRDPEDLDTATFTTLAADQTGEVGLYVAAGEAASVRAALARLLAPIGGWWYFTRGGLLAVGHLKAPSAPTAEIEESDIRAIHRIEIALPAWRRQLGWRRSWTVQRDTDLAASVSDADKQFYANEYRYAESADSTVQGKHRYARAPVLATLFDDEADAQTEADRQQALHGPDRDRFRVTLHQRLYEFFVAQEITLTHSRYGLAGGKDMVIVAVSEDSQSGVTHLEVWG